MGLFVKIYKSGKDGAVTANIHKLFTACGKLAFLKLTPLIVHDVASRVEGLNEMNLFYQRKIN